VTHQPNLSEQLADMARELAAAGDVHETLQRLVELAVDTIDGCEHAGISLVGADHIETHAQSDPVSTTIDRIQADAGEGPARDAIRDQEVFVTGDLAREERWSRFSAEVVEHTGVRSMLAVRLFTDQDTMGSLNLYANRVNAFDHDASAAASILAAHAAVALRAAQEQQRLEEAIETDDIDVVGTAKGLLMVYLDLDEDAAADQLRETARQQNRQLREVADEIIQREPGS
jgi:transcriptional regulator with GAF, ATPase, and Fis domain